VPIAVLVGVGDVSRQLKAGVAVGVIPHLCPRWLGHSRILLDVICEMVATDEEGDARGADPLSVMFMPWPPEYQPRKMSRLWRTSAHISCQAAGPGGNWASSPVISSTAVPNARFLFE